MSETKKVYGYSYSQKPVTVVEIETDYLRRIAEALEAIVNLMTPSKSQVPPLRVYDNQDDHGLGGAILTPHEAGDDK